MPNPTKIRVKTIGITGASGSKYLSGLLDVSVNNVANNDLIIYDTTINKFKSANVSNTFPGFLNDFVSINVLSPNYTVKNTDSGTVYYANTNGNTYVNLPANIRVGTYFCAVSANDTGKIVIQSFGNSDIIIKTADLLSQTKTKSSGPYFAVSVLALRLNPSTQNTEWVIL